MTSIAGRNTGSWLLGTLGHKGSCADCSNRSQCFVGHSNLDSQLLRASNLLTNRSRIRDTSALAAGKLENTSEDDHEYRDNAELENDIGAEFMDRNLLALNVMWKYMEQRSFPLTEEKYILRLDDVANSLKCWGAVSHIRHSLEKLKERPRIGKVKKIRLLEYLIEYMPISVIPLDGVMEMYKRPKHGGYGAVGRGKK